MSNEIKLTQKVAYADLKVLAEQSGRNDLMEFCDKKIAQLEKKASTAKVDEEKEAFQDLIRDVLVENGKPIKCGDVLADERIASFVWKDGKKTSSQRVTSHLKQLILANDVVKSTVKGESYFTLA